MDTGIGANTGGATVTGTAARPAPGRPVPDATLELPTGVVERLDVSGGDVVRVRSYAGREVFTRVSEPVAEQAALLRLGRMLWSQLAVRPGDTLELVREPTPGDATAVTIRPAFHLSHHLGDHVVEFLRKDAIVVWPGAKIFAPIFAGGGGVVVQVESVDADGSATPVEHGTVERCPALVGGQTRIEFAEPDPEIAQRRTTFAEVGGLDNALARLRDLIELPLLRPGLYRSLGVRAPKGVILHGPPGTGKTLLSRAVAEELRANVRKLPATELIGTYSGETEANLRSLFNEAAHHAPTLIIVDEIDVLATSRDRLASQGDIRATTQLLALMDGLEQVDGVVVLATTNRIDSVDEAFRRPGRFDEEIYVGPPGPRARREILAVHTREMPLTRGAEAAFDEVAEAQTSGFTGADLMHLTREVGLAAARRLTRGGGAGTNSGLVHSGVGSGVELADAVLQTELSVLAEDVYAAVASVAPSAMRSLQAVDVPVDWDDFDGLADVQADLLHAGRTALSPGAVRREGVLLIGESGNGKSALVRALARQLRANLVLVDGSSIFTQWLGESEAAIRTLFGKARDVAPSVVVVEHLDAVAPVRVAGHVETASSRVLSALLSSIDESLARGGVLVVGVTDRRELIDPALARAGRLGLHLELPAPDTERRRLLISRAAGERLSPVTVAELVKQTAGASAADVCRRAERLAAR